MVDTLDIQIILCLTRANHAITSKDIAHITSISSKTVQTRIKQLQKISAQFGFEIITKQRSGNQVNIINDDVFQLFLNKYINLEDNSFISTLQKLILLFVSSDSYLKIEELCQKLFVSKGKLQIHLKDLRNILKHYELELESKPYYGLKIIGDEFNWRRFLASNYVLTSSIISSCNERISSLSKESLSQIEHLISNTLNNYQYFFPNSIIENLRDHLFITINRIKTGKTINPLNSKEFSFETVEKEITLDIIKKIENHYEIKFPESETEYFFIHMIGKRVIKDNFNVSSEINELVELILNEINENKNINLLKDFDLRVMLALHLVPLISRIQYGIELKNPILFEVKKQCVAGFDLAILASSVIERKFDKQISIHEISYLALHFDVSLNKEIEGNEKKNILVVCSTGRASAQLLKLKFEQYFSHYLNEITVCDLSECYKILQYKNIDYILTTVPITKTLAVPIFNFEFFLNQNTLQHIENILTDRSIREFKFKTYFKPELFFQNVSFSDRKEALNFLLNKVTDTLHLPEIFSELVWERELYFSTDIIENAAIPHPNKLITEDTFISVMILKKPILWGKKKVSIIFLISISRKDSDDYKYILECITKLLDDQQTMQRVLLSANYNLLLDELINKS